MRCSRLLATVLCTEEEDVEDLNVHSNSVVR